MAKNRELQDSRKINADSVLRAYQQIIDQGCRDGDAHRLDELTARVEFDGYTIALTDGRVTVRLMFHNKLAIDTPNGRALEDFNRRLARTLAHAPH